MQKYEAQTLAIVLVLLVVGSIIGFALYARMIQNSERIVDERASSEANELAETIVGLISTGDREALLGDEVSDFFGGCIDSDLYGDGCYRDEIGLEVLKKDFLAHLGLPNVDFASLEFEDGYCSVEIAMRYLPTNEGLDINQDYAHSLLLNKVDWEDGGCSRINFTMKKLEEGSSGFVMSSFYGDRNEEGAVSKYKEYSHDDIEGFLYSESGEGTWNKLSGNQHTVIFSNEANTYPVSRDDFDIYEVRFKALGGPSNLSWGIEGECKIKEYIQMEVGATCGGKYAGKTFIITGEPYAPPVFDYVFFKGQGNLKMENR